MKLELTDEERELQKQAKKRKPIESPIKFSDGMIKKLNEISIMYFNGNYRFKPSYTSMINFARLNPSTELTKKYLKSKIFQDKYSEFN